MVIIKIEELETISHNKDLLEKKYNECLKVKRETEKIFTDIKNYQLDITDKNRKLNEKKEQMTSYIDLIEKRLENEPDNKLGIMRTVLMQNFDTLTQTIEKNENLANQLSISFGVALDTFKNYIDKIVTMQRKIYE